MRINFENLCSCQEKMRVKVYFISYEFGVTVEILTKRLKSNLTKPQANLAEFTITINGQDFYDLRDVVTVIPDYL